MASRDDFEYRRQTIEEMICPECNSYVQVFGVEHRAEFHEQRFWGQLRICPGTDKIILGNSIRRRTKLAMIKNDKGRFINPVPEDYNRQMDKLKEITDKIRTAIFDHSQDIETVIDELKSDLDDILKDEK